MNRTATLIGLFLVCKVQGQAVLGTGRSIEGLKVFADWENPLVRYVAPGTLKLIALNDGSPDLSFLQMIYVGSAATSDQGVFKSRSILSFGVRFSRPTQAQLSAVKAKILAEEGRTVELKVLALQGLQTHLNYVPAEPPPDTPRTIPVAGSSALEDATSKGESTNELCFDRVFTMQPDEASSQVLWSALKLGTCVLSLSYTAQVMAIDQPARVESSDLTLPNQEKPKSKLVSAIDETIPIQIDTRRDAHKLKQIDINQSVPPGYPALRVFCVDFSNQIRPDLAMKVVEIQAIGVGGKVTELSTTFFANKPDVASSSLRFAFAVDLKRPYRFRTKEVGVDGTSTSTSWKEGKPWGQLLDVTTPPEKRPTPKPDGDGIGKTRS
jgi:hypothetical protein